MDFTLSPEIEALRLRVRAFIEEHVLPLESDPVNFSEHENIPEDRLAVVRAAQDIERRAGRPTEARRLYARAIELASSQAERLGYERKLRLLAN